MFLYRSPCLQGDRFHSTRGLTASTGPKRGGLSNESYGSSNHTRKLDYQHTIHYLASTMDHAAASPLFC